MVASTERLTTTAGPWRRRLALLGLGLILCLAILFPTYGEIFELWWTISSYNHCLLIIPISIYLVTLRRDALYELSPKNSWLGVAYVVANGAIWFAGNLLSLNVLEHLGAIGIVIGMVWALIGNTAFQLLLFPLLYLYFGLPEGDFLVPYLQDLTAKVVVTLLRVTDIPVFLEGRYLTIPSGSFHVAKACSGINYLIATLAVGTVFAYLRFQNTWRRLFFMALAIAVPLAANGIRAYGIVMIAHLSDYKYAMGVDHFIYGWVFFGVVIFALFALGNLFSDADDTAPITGLSQSTAAKPSEQGAWITLVSAVLFVALFRAAGAAGFGYGESDYKFVLPAPAEGWHLQVNSASVFGSRFEGADDSLFASYRSGDAVVNLDAYYYRSQRHESEVVNARNDPFDEDIWRLVDGPHKRVLHHGPVPEVFELVVRTHSGIERRLWYWFDISGAPTLSTIAAKVLSKRAVLTGRYHGEAAILLSTNVDESAGHSADRLERFMIEINPVIDNMIR